MFVPVLASASGIVSPSHQPQLFQGFNDLIHQMVQAESTCFSDNSMEMPKSFHIMKWRRLVGDGNHNQLFLSIFLFSLLFRVTLAIYLKRKKQNLILEDFCKKLSSLNCSMWIIETIQMISFPTLKNQPSSWRVKNILKRSCNSSRKAFIH